MLEAEISFIKEHVLKKGEQLEIPDVKDESSGFVDINIVKKTERTYRLVGVVTVSIFASDAQPDEELLQLGFTPRKKMKLLANHQTASWLRSGFIMYEIRFMKDGRTPQLQHYRMGYPLFSFLEKENRRKEGVIETEWMLWRERALKAISMPLPKQKSKELIQLIGIIQNLCNLQVMDIKQSSYFPESWVMRKRQRFLHFLLAFTEMCLMANQFDWKEIGAHYFQEIGGSKRFDRDKEAFIDQVESMIDCSVVLLGLTSLGRITPLFFSGPVKGVFSSYDFGPVHAITDLSISAERYSTTATTLWLVENRAILTRMAAEENFLKDMNSLILCVDGHLRSSHKRCINQLVQESTIEQILIWSDYDPDGLMIAGELFEAVRNGNAKILKWIQPDLTVAKTFDEYEKYMNEYLMESRMEQEQVAGGREQWIEWVNH